MEKHVALAVPTLNPGDEWRHWLRAYDAQEIKPECFVIDSCSDDETPALSRQAGLSTYTIERASFNHGGTRNYALELCSDFDYVVFMTQDAILADSNSIRNILKPFEDLEVAAVCGRQLPRPGAGAIEAHARLFNYPAESRSNSIIEAGILGLKVAFLSNSFAAYRMSTLKELNGFPDDVIFGEDMYTAAKLLKTGHKIAYAADACVYHSHSYSMIQEFKRYFDMGVFHAREPWIRKEFGAAEGEGLKFVISELKYLARNALWRVPEGMLRTVLRYSGFRMGLVERHIPLKIKRKISMNPGYFKIE